MSSTILLKSAIDYIRMDENASYEEPLQSGSAETRQKPIMLQTRPQEILSANQNLLTLNYLKRTTADVEEKWFKKVRRREMQARKATALGHERPRRRA
jgi:hypothetical protein